MTPQLLSLSEYHACGFLRTSIGPLEAYGFDVFNANYFLTCEQTFLSFMAFSVYGVVRVACLSRVAAEVRKYATEKPLERLRKC